MKNINFPGNHYSLPGFSKDWLRVDLRITQLYITNSNVLRISKDAFNTAHFTTLRILSISNVPISLLYDGAFNGLENLKEIHFDHVKLYDFDGNILAPTKNLDTFKMKNCGDHPVHVDNLFGTVALHHLKYIFIRDCKLFDTITKHTFSALHNITNIQLVSCEITHIGPNSFDIPLQSLKILQLSDNKLKSLPKNLFDGRTTPNLMLFLGNNPWHCGCKELGGLQQMLHFKSDINLNSVICKSPAEYADFELKHCPPLCKPEPPSKNDNLTELNPSLKNDKPMKSTSFPDNFIPLRTETAFITTTNDPYGIEHDNGYEPGDEYEHDHGNHHRYDHENEIEAEQERDIDYEDEVDDEDYDYDDDFDDYDDDDDADDDNCGNHKADDSYVDIQHIPQENFMKVIQCDEPVLNQANISVFESLTGMLSIRVENENLYLTAENLTDDFLLFGLEQQTKSDTPTICLGSFEGGNDQVEIEFQLKPNKMYRFCRKLKNVPVLGSLDCLLYYSKGEPEQLDAWLWTENKAAIISVCVVAALVIVFMGILLSKVLALIFPKQIRGWSSKDEKKIIENTTKTTEEQRAISRLR